MMRLPYLLAPLMAPLLACSLAAPAAAQLTIAGVPYDDGQRLPPQAPVLPPPPLPVEAGSPYVIYPIRGGTFMISGPASNALVQVGLDGVLVVDSGRIEDVQGLLAQVRRLSPRPIRYIMNTSADADHVGGNVGLSGAGLDVGSGNERPDGVQGYGAIPTLAHEQVMFQLLEQGVSEGLPTLTYFVAQKDIFFNGEPVSLIHAPGHTGGDSLVMFRRSDVIAAGDIYTPDRYPEIDLARGGSITAYLASLNHLIALTVPEFNQQGGTFVVPGHGRLSDEGDIQDYRDMVTFIRDRVKAMIDAGMSLEQVKAARPTQDYDPLYGADAGQRFVEQIYTSLTQAAEPVADDFSAEDFAADALPEGE